MMVGQNFDFRRFFQPITGQQTSQVCDLKNVKKYRKLKFRHMNAWLKNEILSGICEQKKRLF